MDEKTLTALQGSIQKWEAIVGGAGFDLGMDNCPLCKIFLVETHYLLGCDGCPVMERTGLDGCDGSPYEEWMAYVGDNVIERKVFDERSKELAQAELYFLQSLLPKECTETAQGKL